MIENLKTSTRENEINCIKLITAENKTKHASPTLWIHGRSPQSAVRQYIVWETQVCSWMSKVSLLQGA